MTPGSKRLDFPPGVSNLRAAQGILGESVLRSKVMIPCSLIRRGVLAGAVVLCLGLAAGAKDLPVTAIVLYEGPSGPAYVQATDLLVNAKNELLVCTAGSRLDANGYKKLPKVKILGAVALERDASGTLMLTTAGGTSCVVPSGLKLEKKDGSLSPSDFAERAQLGGRVLARSSNGADAVPAEFKIGTRLVFVNAPDTELAEYLRAARAQQIPLWRDYVRQFPSGPHIGEARQSLAGLIVAQGEQQFAAYQRSVSDRAPAYERMSNAKAQAEDALRVFPGFARAQKLLNDIRGALEAVLTTGRNELQAYLRALADHTPGHEHLVKAKGHVDDVQKVDAAFDPGLKLRAEVYGQVNALDVAMQQAEALIGVRRHDDAYAAIQRYRSFAEEVPRIGKIVETVFAFHRDRGNQAANEARWEDAIAEYKKALAVRPDNEVTAAMTRADTELNTKRNQEAAAQAKDQSAMYAKGRQFVEAYEVLANLPEAQQSYVSNELEALRKDYVVDAAKRADALTRVHVPIRGKADEDGVRQAFGLLQRASQVSGDEVLKVKLDLLGDRISGWYVDKAKQYAEKPRGTGVGLGWSYLAEAQYFKPDRDEVKDLQAKYGPLYQTRSKLSLAVRFRDATSRREGGGFADQLADGLATGLEHAGIQVKVINASRPGEASGPDAAGMPQANFQLIGDILQHRPSKKSEPQPVQSEYRAGDRPVKNPKYLEAKRQVDVIQEELSRAKDAQTQAMARNKKREMQDAAAVVAEAARKLAAAKQRMDSIEDTLYEPVIRPYSYTKRTVEVSYIVEIAFHLADANGNPLENNTTVKKEIPKSAVLLENVKTEDVHGVLESGSPPDEEQVRFDTETAAQEELVKRVGEKLHELPLKILQAARARIASGDSEGAAEQYILYLNSTPDAPTTERDEASRFLRKEFNITALHAGQ